jgi:hypothetical protein
MRKIIFFLLAIFLFSVFIDAVDFSFAMYQTSSFAPSHDDTHATDTKSGNVTLYDVDYWWISNVNQGEQVLVNIQNSIWDWWTTVIYYSNLTEVPYQNLGNLGTHIHQFIASKADNYLLRIDGDIDSVFNYTIESTHPVAEQTMYTKSGIHIANSVNYHTLSGVSKGDKVLVDVQQDVRDWWTTVIYYSNLTEVPYQNLGNLGTHMHQFVVDKTDTYLLRITSGTSFNYTIESTHPIDAGQLPPTEIRFVLTPNPATVGGTVLLQGTLTSNGNPVPSAPVTIKLGVTPVGTLITNSTGWFKASGSVASAGSYNITVEYAGSPQYLPSANWTILVVKEATKIYCRIDPNPVNVGGSFTYEGILVNGYSKPLAGATIQLYKRTLTGSWTYITSVTTNSYGIFTWQSTASTVGTFVFAAYYAGSETRESNYNFAVQVVQ